MRKKRGILFGVVLACAVSVAAGCGDEKKINSIEEDQPVSSDSGEMDNDDEENPFDVEEMESAGEEILANYGWGIENYDGKKRELSYDGKSMEIDLSFDNDSEKFQAGVLIFIDGIAQKYSLEPQGTEDYILPVDIDKKDDQIVKLYFKPRFEEKKEDHIVHFASMYEPSYRVSEKKKGYGAYHNISLLSPWSLHGKDGAERELNGKTVKYSGLTKEEKDFYIYKKDDGTIKNTLDTMKFELMQDNVVLEGNAVDKNKDLQLNILGGEETKYRLSAWLDGKPAKVFAGKEYEDFTVKADRRAVVSMNFSDIASRYSSLEFIACPIADDALTMEYMMEKSDVLYME